MKYITKQFEIIKNDFKFKNKKNDLIKLNFLNNVSASSVWLSKKTGLVFHNEPKSSIEIAKEWSEKIFSKKMDPEKNYYTDNIPEMRARHYYVLDFMNNYLKLKDKKIFDFAFGQGGLLKISSESFKCRKISGVEFSKINFSKVKKLFNKKKGKIIYKKLINSSIEDVNLSEKEKPEIGFLTWTLCNCNDPIEVVKSLKNNIKKNGYLAVAESARILVPFKKIIQNYFVSNKKIGHTHPWHWSLNSLLNIFKIFGFEPKKINRFYDVNDLVIIFQNKNNYNQKIVFDDYKKVLAFLKRWNIESKNFKFK